MNKSGLFFKTCAFIILMLVCLGGIALAQMPLLCPLPGTGSSDKPGICSAAISTTPANPKHFVFIAAGDNRPKKWCQPQPDVPKKIFAASGKMKPAFIVWTGDTIFGKM